MKAFIVGLVLLLSVGVAGASEYSSIADHYTLSGNLAKQLVYGMMNGLPLEDILKFVTDIEEQTTAIGVICEQYKVVFSRYMECMDVYAGSAKFGAMSTINAAEYANKLGDKATAKKLYRSVITTYTGPAYRSYVKKAEFALEDLKGN